MKDLQADIELIISDLSQQIAKLSQEKAFFSSLAQQYKEKGRILHGCVD